MKRAFIYGDSNTYGYDPRDFSSGRYPKEQRWTTILQKQVKTVYELIPDGLNGRKIPDVYADMTYLEKMIRDHQPLDLFICMLGTNDILSSLSPDGRVPAEKMDRFITWLRDKKAASEILLIAPPLIGETGDEFFKSFHRENSVMNRQMKELAQRHHIHFADASQWNIQLMYDQVHFSVEGCRTFASEMEKLLQNI